MLKQIKIKNFRGFHTLEINIPKVLVLMGPNSSGKTTALHAIRIACQGAWMTLENDIKYTLQKDTIIFKDFIIRRISDLMPLADWQALFIDQKVGESIHFSIQLLFEDDHFIKSISLEGKYARNENLKIITTLEIPQILNNFGDLNTKNISYKNKIFDDIKKHLPKSIFIPPFYGIICDEEYRVRAVIDSMIGSADQSHVVRNMVARLTPQQFIQLNAFLKDLIGAELIQRTQGDEVEQVSSLRVTFRDSNGELELSAAGAGLINLVAIYSSLARWQAESATREIIFLLDEPEAHLHPHLQSVATHRLADIITSEFQAQLIIATHSIDIINKMGDREDTAIFRTDRLHKTTGGQELIGQTALLNDMARWADMTPFSAINFLASKRIFFYEGKSDGMMIKKCADILYRNHPKNKKSFEKWTFVPLYGCGNEKIAKLLAKIIESNIIPSKIHLNEFKILIQLDKDYTNEKSFCEPIEENTIPTFRNIWSKHSIESLFCETHILFQWLRLKYPHISEDTIENAIKETNKDKELNEYAKDQRHLFLLKKMEKKDENIIHTSTQARQDMAKRKRSCFKNSEHH